MSSSTLMGVAYLFGGSALSKGTLFHWNSEADQSRGLCLHAGSSQSSLQMPTLMQQPMCLSCGAW